MSEVAPHANVWSTEARRRINAQDNSCLEEEDSFKSAQEDETGKIVFRETKCMRGNKKKKQDNRKERNQKKKEKRKQKGAG